MNSPFSFVAAAPAVKVADLASYKLCLAEYESHVARMVAAYGHLMTPSYPPAPPTLQTNSSPASATPGDGKGQWERQWLDQSGLKSVRFTSRVQSLYETKEDYCQALCEGTADAGDDTLEIPPPSRWENVDSVPPLF